ncbi:MAG TPA: LacI family transcriptional regulator [Epulopiscium sp.]|nr:LacI family transcriptional regulator [Candidatus Epulonipiscium sp.]
MVTIYDIAKVAKVSGATVSKALNDHSDISDKTKVRIKKLAVEMEYQPNSHARSLITKRSYNIGVLFADESNSGLTHAFFAAILESARAELEERGYDITFISSKFAKQKNASFLEHCRYRGVDGVIIACIDFNAEDVIQLINSNIPVVLIDKEIAGKSSIISQNHEGVKRAVNHLVENGHKDIGFIHGQYTSTEVTPHRISGFYEAMQEANIKPNKNWIMEGAYYEWEVTAKSCEKILKMKHRPTALLLPDDYAALAVYRTASQLNIRIPEDISLVGYDGLEFSRIMTPRLTTIKQDTEMIGKLAGEKIVNLIENNQKQQVIYVPTVILEGSSVKKLN